MAHLDIIVTGRVQGVGFRYNARQAAERLGLKGYARNLPDGSVAIEVEGSDTALRKFLEWCKQGSSNSQVNHLEVSTKSAVKGHRDFRVY